MGSTVTTLQNVVASDPDVRLMLRVREDDQEAFSELERSWRPVVQLRLAKRLGSFHDAEDLTQQVFLNLHECRKRYKPAARFDTFLSRIVHNVALNALRTSRSRPPSFTNANLSLIEERKDLHRISQFENCISVVEHTAAQCVKTMCILLDGTPDRKRKRKAQAVFRCLPRVLYATILPYPREFYSFFTQTVVEMVKRLGLRVASGELRRLTVGAHMLQTRTCTGNFREDLAACGFIPPQPGVWKWFVAAALIEGSDALTLFRKELVLQRKRLTLSKDAYSSMNKSLTPCCPGNLGMVDEQVFKLLIQPARLRLAAADTTIELIHVSSDSNHVLIFTTHNKR